MKHFYLIAAIVGALAPYVFFTDFALTEGIDLVAFIQALFANGAVAGFTTDLLISSVVFWVFMWTRRETGPQPWLFIVLNLTIGLSCALPAYLWVHQRQISAPARPAG